MDERWRLRLGRVEQRSWVEVTLEKLPYQKFPWYHPWLIRCLIKIGLSETD